METETKQQPEKRTLVKKLCEVMAAVERVAKRGRNEFHKYDYVTEADLADAIRSELAKRHLFIFPNVKACERKPLEVETTKWIKNEPTPSIRKTQLTEIQVEWTFVDGESGEERTIVVHGVGEDNVDKGFYKAFTGSEKYMLMKSFLIPTGDDPEQDSKDDAKAARERGKADAKVVGEAKAAAGRQGGNGAVTALFYTEPPSQNGHFVEFLNIREFLSTRQDIEDALRMMFTKHRAKKTKDETVLVPSGELQPLLEELVGEMGLTIKKLEAAANA